MGSSNGLNSCDEAQLWGWIRNDLSSAWSALLASGQSRLSKVWVQPLSFLVANIEHLAYGHSMLTLVAEADHLCSYGVLPPRLSPLQSYSLSIGILFCLSGEVSLPAPSWEFRYHRLSSSDGLLAQESSIGRSWMSDNGLHRFFSQEERIHAKSELVSLLLDVFSLCTWMDLIKNFHYNF